MKKDSRDYSKGKTSLFIILIFTGCLTYILLRNIIFGTVTWNFLPFIAINKALALTAIILLVFVFSGKRIRQSRAGLFRNLTNHLPLIGNTALIMISAHSLISIRMLNPELFSRFYNFNTLNIWGILAIIAGVFAFLLILIYYFNIQSTREKNQFRLFLKRIKISWLIISLVFIHVFFTGFTEWIHVASWPGYLVPESLIIAIFIVSGLYFFTRGK
ncbi:MAG: hypothetical protein JXJ22_12930 [Bacteroidales bacterium]|nr:hypothetical protein [Bacteroidales bacterium]